MARLGNQCVASALAIALLASGAHEWVHAWLSENSRPVSWEPGIIKAAAAEGDVEADEENHIFSLFSGHTAEAFTAHAKEGAIITLPGSEDTYLFASEIEDAVTWSIDEKAISVTVGSSMDEDGKSFDYIVMSHSDSKKRITRSLTQRVSAAGEPAYSISKTDRKGTTAFSLTAEEHQSAEQEFRDPKSFDLIFEATKKAVERANVLYLFSQETFDYLEEHWKSIEIDFPGKEDTFTIHSRASIDSTDWWLNDKGLQIGYKFEEDEEGKKRVVAVALYHYVAHAEPRISKSLFIGYRGEEPIYSIRKINNSLPMEDENRIDEYPLTPDQFAWAVTQFKKSPKSFDSIFQKAPKRTP